MSHTNTNDEKAGKTNEETGDVGILPPSTRESIQEDAEDAKTFSVTHPEPANSSVDDFPEGGFRAWSVVFGAVLMTFSTFGFVNTWGVFQEYYASTLLKDKSPSTIAWIGSLQYCLTLFPGLLSGRLFDIGIFRAPLLIATTVLIVSCFLVAECTEYWQFMLGQGLALGLGAGFNFGPTIAVVSHYFHKRRSTAYGVVACGSSLGGTLLPIAVRKLLPQVGFPWTMRILGFILIVTTGVANLLLRRRLPAKKVSGGLINPRAFKYPPYTLYVLSVFVGFLGMYTVLTYLDSAAVTLGINADFSFYLISIANAGSMVGRLSSGILSDRYGPLNVLIPFSVLAAIMTYIWPYCTNLGSLVVISIIYGIASGAFVGLIASPVAFLGSTEDIGRRTGMLFTVAAVGALVGPPISGAIHDAQNGYHGVGAYAGSVILLGVFLMLAARWEALGRKWVGRF